MRDSRTRLGLVALLLALVTAWPLLVHAAARATAPVGWWESSDAASAAKRRASSWQAALGLGHPQVMSARDDDRFAETVAVFERAEPIAEQTLADEALAVAALSETVANIVDSQAPEASGLRTIDSGAQVIWGQWTVGEHNYECVLAPSGDTATLMIMVVLASEVDEQRERLDGMIASLEGVTAPMPRFSLTSWRVGALLVWLALGLALHAAMLRFVDQEQDHNQAGRRASAINLGFVVIGTVAAYLTLEARELALTHAGSSLEGLTMWIAVSGIVVAGAHFLIAARQDRGVVQSAPTSGVFSSGTYSRSDMLRSSLTRSSGVQPRVEELGELGELGETSDVWEQPDHPGDPRTQTPANPGNERS